MKILENNLHTHKNQMEVEGKKRDATLGEFAKLANSYYLTNTADDAKPEAPLKAAPSQPKKRRAASKLTLKWVAEVTHPKVSFGEESSRRDRWFFLHELIRLLGPLGKSNPTKKDCVGLWKQIRVLFQHTDDYRRSLADIIHSFFELPDESFRPPKKLNLSDIYNMSYQEIICSGMTHWHEQCVHYYRFDGGTVLHIYVYLDWVLRKIRCDPQFMDIGPCLFA